MRVGGVVAIHDYTKRHRKASVELGVDLIERERPEFVEVGFVSKEDGGGLIAFQKGELPT